MSLEPQLWCMKEGRNTLSLRIFKPIQNDPTWLVKPAGGLWTSTFTPDGEYCSDWIGWCCREDEPEWASGKCWILIPKNNMKIYTIDTYQDLINLYNKYPRKLRIGREVEYGIDYEKYCRDYDALHLTLYGQVATRYPKNEVDHLNLYGWDTETVMWCRPKFQKIYRIRKTKSLKCKLRCSRK